MPCPHSDFIGRQEAECDQTWEVDGQDEGGSLQVFQTQTGNTKIVRANMKQDKTQMQTKGHVQNIEQDNLPE